MGEKDGWLPPEQRLIGASNINAWLLTITAILLSLGLNEFLFPPPEDMPAAGHRRWDLRTASDHSKAYGHVVKNIGNSALQTDALRHQQDGRPLHEFMSRLRNLQRTEIEIAADIDSLHWEQDDNITTFFQRGQRYYHEMMGAHPGALSEHAFLTRMLTKLPPSYADAARVVTGSGTLAGAQPSLERSISYFKQVEAQSRVTDKKQTKTPDNASPTSGIAGAAGPTGPTDRAANAGTPTTDIQSIAMVLTNTIKNSLKNYLRPRGGRVQKKDYDRNDHFDRNRGRTQGGRGNGGGGNGNGYQSCQTDGGRRFSSGKRCFNCGSTDHLANQCPFDRNGGSHGYQGSSRHNQNYNGGHNHNHGNGNNYHKHNNHNNNHNHNHAYNNTPCTLLPFESIYNSPIILVGMNQTQTKQAFYGLHHYDYLMDSAATTHVCNDASHFLDYTPLPFNRSDSVMTGAGPLTVKGYGVVRVTDDYGNTYLLKHVMYVPDSPVCLFSTIKLNREGGSFTASPTTAHLQTNHGSLYTNRTYKGIYLLSLYPPCEFVNVQVPGKTGEDHGATLDTWHARLGHVGFSLLSRLAHGTYVTGMHIIGNTAKKAFCLACTMGKFKKNPYPTQNKPLKPLEVIHSDICGPLPTGLNGHKYFVTLRDNCTGYTMVRTISERSNAHLFIQESIEYLERQTPYKVKYVRLDKGGEFTSYALQNWLKQKGIQPQFTATECSQSNGVAERTNLTIMDRLRATLIHSNQPRLLWPWAVEHIVTAMNYLPYSGQPNVTPHQHLFQSIPDVSYLKPFGARVITWIATQDQSDKLSSRGADGRMVGYVHGSSHLYQVNF
jgi:hypothetical protein